MESIVDENITENVTEGIVDENVTDNITEGIVDYINKLLYISVTMSHYELPYIELCYIPVTMGYCRLY